MGIIQRITMSQLKKVLFIDRDGTIIEEPPVDFQIDSLEKFRFCPAAIRNLHLISRNLSFELSMVTNQDGLGTPVFPEENFWPPHQLMVHTLEGEGVVFDDVFIDRSFPADNAPTRKPRTGMLGKYLTGDYDLAGSFVIGDRLTDIELAKNLGSKGILYTRTLTADDVQNAGLAQSCVLITNNWDEIYTFLLFGERTAEVRRTTNETDILVKIDLDGRGENTISTGLGFFDHMLDQIGRHSGVDLTVNVHGDLHVDEHHTIEDTALALGECFLKALGSKRGIERYGFALPMDDCHAQVLLDFGGRPWLNWRVEFRRERIGEMPTEMFYHFFKSFADAARCNLDIEASGDNEHHKAEALFKALAKAIKMAIRRDPFNYRLPSTKGVL